MVSSCMLCVAHKSNYFCIPDQKGWQLVVQRRESLWARKRTGKRHGAAYLTSSKSTWGEQEADQPHLEILGG